MPRHPERGHSTPSSSGRHAFRSHFKWLVGLVFLLLINVGQIALSQRIVVTEAAGLRRFGYPVTASLELAQGQVPSIDKIRLVDASSQEVAAQFTALSLWPDGSVRACDVDFVTGMGPQEIRSFRIEAGVSPKQAMPTGLIVKETDEAIMVVSSSMQHRIRRDGRPLLESITFDGDEFLAKDGVVTSAKVSEAKVVKRGPFNVTIEMGHVRLEYVSSKSWVKLTQRVEATEVLAVEGQFHVTSDPLMWDFGLGSWLYGTSDEGRDVVQVDKEGSLWQVVTTSPDELPSLYATAPHFDGCGHLADQERVAAFGIANCRSLDDVQIHLRGDGHLRLSASSRELTVFFHLVGQPTQVTALTNPQSMVAPLMVSVQASP